MWFAFIHFNMRIHVGICTIHVQMCIKIVYKKLTHDGDDVDTVAGNQKHMVFTSLSVHQLTLFLRVLLIFSGSQETKSFGNHKMHLFF